MKDYALYNIAAAFQLPYQLLEQDSTQMIENLNYSIDGVYPVKFQVVNKDLSCYEVSKVLYILQFTSLILIDINQESMIEVEKVIEELEVNVKKILIDFLKSIDCMYAEIKIN